MSGDKIKKKTYVMNKDFKNIPRARMISRRCTTAWVFPTRLHPTTSSWNNTTIDGSEYRRW